jgi:hypothetical protein
MYINWKPKVDPSTFPEPAEKVVENPAASGLPLTVGDSFETLRNPSAVDKMLLPACSSLNSAVEGNSGNGIPRHVDKNGIPKDVDRNGIPKHVERNGIPKHVEGNGMQLMLESRNEKDKELKISEDEKMEQVIDLQKLTKFLKI